MIKGKSGKITILMDTHGKTPQQIAEMIVRAAENRPIEGMTVVQEKPIRPKDE